MISLDCDDWSGVVKELNSSVRDWYVATFPTDSLGPKIPDLTFWDAVGALNLGADIYCFLGDAADSVVRERLFLRIAEIVGCGYNAVYNTWLGGGN